MSAKSDSVSLPTRRFATSLIAAQTFRYILCQTEEIDKISDSTHDFVAPPNGERHSVSDEIRVCQQSNICRRVVAVCVHRVRPISCQRRGETHICRTSKKFTQG